MMLLIVDDLPGVLTEQMQAFTRERPDWSQSRILQNALSLFLLQNGVNDRELSEVYLKSMFGALAQGESDE